MHGAFSQQYYAEFWGMFNRNWFVSYAYAYKSSCNKVDIWIIQVTIIALWISECNILLYISCIWNYYWLICQSNFKNLIDSIQDWIYSHSDISIFQLKLFIFIYEYFNVSKLSSRHTPLALRITSLPLQL